MIQYLSSRSKALPLILLLFFLATALYYWGDVSWLPASAGWRSFTNTTLYRELVFVLFGLLVLFVSFLFRARGAVIASLSVTAIVIPHAVIAGILIGPHIKTAKLQRDHPLTRSYSRRLPERP